MRKYRSIFCVLNATIIFHFTAVCMQVACVNACDSEVVGAWDEHWGAH